MELEEVDFQIDSIINQLTNIIIYKAEEKSIQFSVQFANDIPKNLRGDPVRLEQILVNLCNNAVKFTPQGGQVTVRVRLKELKNDDLVLHFSVIDTGIGLSAEQQQKLFHSFIQGDASTNRKYGGTGLGLSIAKQITQLMKGEIWIESQEGKGSSFHFTAHLKKASEDYSVKELEYESDSLDESLKNLREAKILIVEDNEINQELAYELLSEEGIKAEIANNGQEALDFLASHIDFDGVLMDCQMPVMDGYEATRRIRQQDQFNKLPIIAMTANVMKQDILKVLSVGMNDHIAKPIDPKRMFLTMAKWIKVSKQPQEQQLSSTFQSPKQSIKNSSLYELVFIDATAGLKTTSNNEKLYRSLLSKFQNNQKDFEKEFREYLNNQDLGSATKSAHTLKGLAANLGMIQLQQSSLQLEMACRKTANNIEELFTQTLLELNRVFNELKNIN